MPNSRWTSALLKSLSSFFVAVISLRPLIFLLVFHFCFSLAYIIIIAHLFTYSKKMVVLHLLIITGGLFLITLAFVGLAASRTLQTKKPARLLFAIVSAVCFTSLILLYTANTFSNYFWHDNMSYLLLIHSVDDLSRYLRAANLSPSWAYLLIVSTFLVIFLFYFKVSPAILKSFDALAARVKKLFHVQKAIVPVTSVCVVLVLAYSACVLMMLRKIHGAGRSQGEPIVNFFAPKFFTEGKTGDARTLSERKIRAQYVAPPNFERKNVVLIIVDDLRPDHTSAYGYQRETTPFLNQLLREGHLRKVKLALSNCPFSTCGILSLLTSRNAEEQHEDNLKLYDLLYDQGYKVYLILSGEQTGMAYLKRSYGQSMNLFFDGSSSKHFATTDDRILFEGLQQVPAFYGVPSFFYFHLMSAHRLGVPFEDNQKYQPVPREKALQILQNYEPVELNNAYDNRVLQADSVIRQLFDALDQKGYLKDSLIVIVADHGEAMGEHGTFGHGKHLYQEELGIPLLFYDNSDANYQNLQFAAQIDVAPTIFERLGLPIPSSWEGHSLMEPYKSGYSYHQTFETVYSHQQSSKIVPGRAAVVLTTDKEIFKYIYSEAEQKEEFYELTTDPGEKNNLISQADQALLSRMREIMARHVANVR